MQVITQVRSALIRLIIEANVVVLPVPVGPVINTKPFCLRANSAMTGGNCSSSMEGTNKEYPPEGRLDGTALNMHIDAKTVHPAQGQGKSSSLSTSNFIFWVSDKAL